MDVNGTTTVCVALDVSSAAEADEIFRKLQGTVGLVKVGLELFCSEGPGVVRGLVSAGAEVFLDLKLNDIPNTVERAVRAVSGLGASLLTLHSLGGVQMMRAARRSADDVAAAGIRPPRLLAVTILTSIDDAALRDELSVGLPLEDEVRHLALQAKGAGLDGVVCSPKEISLIRECCGPEFLVVTPGIRPTWASAQDQRRVLSPREAHLLGSDILVIGRPITGADNPAEAAARILAEMQ